MNIQDHLRLLQHEHWANLKICSMLISLETIPSKSRVIFNHIIAAQDNWFSRVKGTVPSLEIWWTNDDISQWEKLLNAHYDQWVKLLEEPGILERKITYRNTKGLEFTNTVSEIIQHLCLHSQYHRGQVVAYARDLIEPVPSTDYIVFLRR